MSGNVLLDDATTVYNCHSYAWYRYSTANPYWIMDISQFTLDSACTQISASSAQANDIIVYLNAAGNPVHSGVVYSVSSSGELTICSKWGQEGAYRHAVGRVPGNYCTTPGSGTIRYVLFRYHDYMNKYIGNHYHSGTSHYFQFADVCDVCGKRTNTTWQTLVCSGPPCNVAYSVPKPEEID
ncbi:MAG: hypothetical protein IJA35_05630 [Clostridia bacterium]|nr:hypothetical protein [Clostridia bacterium]